MASGTKLVGTNVTFCARAAERDEPGACGNNDGGVGVSSRKLSGDVFASRRMRSEVAMVNKRLSVIVAAAALAAACSDSDARLAPAGPAALRADDGFSERAPFVGINPTSLTSELINSSVACPAVQPFLVRTNLVIRPNPDDFVFISSVRMQFTDTAGNAAPAVTLTSPVPTRPFGTALEEARTIPLAFPFGCGVGRHGTLVVITNTRDRNGRESTNRLTATVG
jgi:hypothetical protein